MTRTFYTSQSGNLQPGRKIAVGGEGEIYEVLDRNNLVAKLYHEPPSAEKAEKLIALARLGTERLLKISAWPVDVLLDAPDGHVIGFLMNRIDQAEEIHTLHSPKSRLQKFPEASWAFLIYVAANIARAVAATHDHGLIIGDLNPKNILVTKKATVYLLDCDSFQVTANGKTYRCEAGFPEYTPPELQGLAFKKIDRKPLHDYFGLAVVIFQLLFVGRHPFSGRFLGGGEMPLERAIGELRFAYGDEAELRRMLPPPGSLPFDAVPQAIADLFTRAFLATAAADRPQPREWVEPLETLAKSLKKCSLHSGHFYYRQLTDCPWCKLESLARVRLFNFMLPGANGTRGGFRLAEIWREIERIEPPNESLPTQIVKLKRPVASPLAASFAWERFSRLILALTISALAGFVISYIPNTIMAVWLLIIVGIWVSRFAKTGHNIPDPVQTIFRGQPSVSNDPFVQKVQASKQQAKDAVRQIEKQWEKISGNERFLNKVNELQAKSQAYVNLSHIRTKKLKQLESKARKTQLNDYLNQFEVKDAEIKGIWSSTKATLHICGIETAADITDRKLKYVPNTSKYVLIKMLEWRRDLEERFVFDPSTGVSPQARISFEKEMDEVRHRLEHELGSGPFYLYRIKQEIEENRKHLQPLLIGARHTLAQAEKDAEVVAKRNPLWPIVAVLIIAFFFGMLIQPRWNGRPLEEIPNTYEAPKAPVPPMPRENPVDRERVEAKSFYEQGVVQSRMERFGAAAKCFQTAIKFDPEMVDAYEELGYAYYRLGQYDACAEVSKQAIRLKNSFASYYHLGLAYVKLKNWEGAKVALEMAIQFYYNSSWNEQFSDACDRLGYTLIQLGEADETINGLERIFENDPSAWPLGRFRLADLYCRVGKYKAARAQYKILVKEAPEMAQDLRKLMLRHGIRL